ncbi:MAG: PAS domain S-box protein [Pseudooceanicola sp.]|nr:PAS domain S-box protein [Pseudooceanicola sp.]
MAWVVLQELDDLSTASSDNRQWTLAQADVEFMRYRLALELAVSGGADLAQVRQAFDVFYSRIATIESGSVYSVFRDDPSFADHRQRIKAFLDETVPFIDAPDDRLGAALPDLENRGRILAGDVRALSLAGLTAFAKQSEATRFHLKTLLTGMALTLALLVAGLALLSYFLFRIARLAQGRARQVHRSATRLRTIVESSQDAIIVTDLEGRIREFNPAAARLFGHRPDAVLGEDAVDLLVPSVRQPLVRQRMAAMRKGDRPSHRRIQRTGTIGIDGHGRHFPAELSAVLVDDGTRCIFIAFIRDVSQTQAANESLIAARDRALARERARVEFMAAMSARLRLSLDRITETLAAEPETTGSATRGDDPLGFLTRLVDDVGELTHIDSGRVTVNRVPVSVNDLLDGLVRENAARADAQDTILDWKPVPARSETIETDPDHLRRILGILIGNAVRFTNRGKVTVTVEPGTDRQGTIELVVADTGSGIASSELPFVFNDFAAPGYRNAHHAAGSGLGLGIARRLARLLGGEIVANSTLGVGSEFRLRLPFDAAASDAARPRKESRVGAAIRNRPPKAGGAEPTQRQPPSRNVASETPDHAPIADTANVDGAVSAPR